MFFEKKDDIFLDSYLGSYNIFAADFRNQSKNIAYEYERKNKVENRRVLPFDASDREDIASL